MATDEINQQVIHYMLNNNLIEENTFVLLTKGRVFGQPGGTNSLEILRVTR